MGVRGWRAVLADSGGRGGTPNSDRGARDHHRALAALAADLGFPAKTVGEPAANHSSEPSADRVHGAARHPGSLSRVLGLCILDHPESAAADGHLFFRLRHCAAEQVRAGPEPHRFRALFSGRHATLACVFRTRRPRGVRYSRASQFRQEAGISTRHSACESSSLRAGHRAFRRRSVRRRIADHSPLRARGGIVAACVVDSAVAVHAGYLLVPGGAWRLHAGLGPDHGTGSDDVVFHYADLLSGVDGPVARDFGCDAQESAVRVGARLSGSVSGGPRAGIPAPGEAVGDRAGLLFLGARLVLPPAEKLRRRDLIFAVLESPRLCTTTTGTR